MDDKDDDDGNEDVNEKVESDDNNLEEMELEYSQNCSTTLIFESGNFHINVSSFSNFQGRKFFFYRGGDQSPLQSPP